MYFSTDQKYLIVQNHIHVNNCRQTYFMDICAHRRMPNAKALVKIMEEVQINHTKTTHSTSDLWPHPDGSLSSPPLIQLDQFMLLKNKHQHFSPLEVHSDLFWNSCTEVCTHRRLRRDAGGVKDRPIYSIYPSHNMRIMHEPCMISAPFIYNSLVIRASIA